jgi:transcriptional regulator with XRE-family HTH domain
MPRESTKHRDADLLRRFGGGVRLLREAKDLSQEDFAELVDVHRTYVGMIERAEKSPTLGTNAAWAKAFRLRPSELLAKVGL